MAGLGNLEQFQGIKWLWRLVFGGGTKYGNADVEEGGCGVWKWCCRLLVGKEGEMFAFEFDRGGNITGVGFFI